MSQIKGASLNKPETVRDRIRQAEEAMRDVPTLLTNGRFLIGDEARIAIIRGYQQEIDVYRTFPPDMLVIEMGEALSIRLDVMRRMGKLPEGVYPYRKEAL